MIYTYKLYEDEFRSSISVISTRYHHQLKSKVDQSRLRDILHNCGFQPGTDNKLFQVTNKI